MAEETDLQEREPKKKKKIKPGLILLGLVVGVGVGYWIGTTITEKNYAAHRLELLQGGRKPPIREPKNLIGDIYKGLTFFLVNLNDPHGKRYLKIKIDLEMDKPKLKKELDKREAQIRGGILDLISNESSSTLISQVGKFTLRQEIFAMINGLLVDGKIKRVYFTEFTIQ